MKDCGDIKGGEIKIKLFPEELPKACENFTGLTEMGYYDELIFHRIIPNFMNQGGDPQGTGFGGQ
ncbi:MAG: peptidylprolyl isomerase, partial [Oscillospiraceae bacterium]|nr:peptidylprolyl isomerase [Oscillospiraceae bacterium]